jgi:hypothetical protein
MTLEVVLFDDVELLVTGALRTALVARAEPYTDDVYVSISSPTDPDTGQPETPARMVTIRRDGGPRLDVARDQPRIAVNVWATTEQDCNDLARMVAALIWALPDGDPILRVDQTSGPTTIPDDRPHKYLTFDLLMRGVDS